MSSLNKIEQDFTRVNRACKSAPFVAFAEMCVVHTHGLRLRHNTINTHTLTHSLVHTHTHTPRAIRSAHDTRAFACARLRKNRKNQYHRTLAARSGSCEATHATLASATRMRECSRRAARVAESAARRTSVRRVWKRPQCPVLPNRARALSST